ncbi:glycoside hydrolase family 99-like domain-containing protein [Dyella marensis]|uniref:glycoside hydrolase family 99-like domain-containing protein n=1 Tax=Dyella TaxID=231454 RepID=UPI00144749D3|nr:glycoside hydrolase family 99-like domain-containing protein [Dyella sp. SG609]NKJ20881.1 GT2 family glycosyltransferase/2-polyprenyl-3-methyl-5-hydroxy-6-metoxy-1,4-benzoquinol methylase [Dyella sp. SG609]
MNVAAASLAEALRSAGYVLDAEHRVWSHATRPAKPFAYSDGDEVEQRIRHAIASSSDVSLFSTELERHQIDWPSVYHLSADRANLLRPIGKLFAGARVLEIGAGCGAITRYLGECGAQVLALEGSPRRASIAASRCRDLPGVTVMNDRFDALETDAKFDVVTLIGVLEYARMYTAGEDPIAETLRRAHQLLSDDGVLIVAIENQLGLKYFAGIPEDHLGRAMAGIEDGYRRDGVVTFGKQELQRRIAAAGYARSEVAMPFPDYKLPGNVILPAALQAGDAFDAASLAGQASRKDRQIRYSPLFSMSRAFAVLGRNGLLDDMANSFLVIAGKSQASATFEQLAPGVLAELYSTQRHPAYKKLSRFTRSGDGVRVSRERLIPSAAIESRLLLNHATEETYLAGQHWSERFEQIVVIPGWSLQDVSDWFGLWLRALAKAMPGSPKAEELAIDTPVPAQLFDAMPDNLIVGHDGEARFFDLEWHFHAPLTVGYLGFRALKLTFGTLLGVAVPADRQMLHTATLIRETFRKHGYVLTSTHIQTYLDLEAALIAEVQGQYTGVLELADYQSHVMSVAPDVGGLLAGHSSAQATLAESAELRTAISELIERLDASAEAPPPAAVQPAPPPAIDIEAVKQAAKHEAKNEARVEHERLRTELDRFRQEHDRVRAEQERLRGELGQAEQQRQALTDELAVMRQSHSWKLTAPLRSGRTKMSSLKTRLRQRTVATVKTVYRRLPIGMGTKLAIKNALFRAFGPLLSHTAAYRRWRAYQGTHAPSPSFTVAPPAYQAPSPMQSSGTLWQADGVREWADYGAVKQRIADSTQALRARRQPASFPLLDFSRLSADAAAAKVKLPLAAAQPTVTILVPAYNHLITTLECLASIAAAQRPGDPDFEVLVANDASTDDTAQVLATIANLRVVNQPANLGFLRNCNTAAREARGKYLLFLNNDVQVTPGWLKALVDCIDGDATVGAAGPRIVYPSGWLQEAGTRWHRDGTAELVGLNDQPDLPRYCYNRDVDYCSGACLLVRQAEFQVMGGFDERYAPAYCEDSDLCMRLRAAGKRIVYCGQATVLHHLSLTSEALPSEYKLNCIAQNLDTFTSRWREQLDALDTVRTIAFYLPQFHPIPENDLWWGRGFTEWTNVSKAQPNYVGHYQPRMPADLGYYDLRLPEVLEKQAELARRYGIGGFCFYYYWFAGHRLLERPIEQMLATSKPDFPFCLCWANENWTRRWDGQEHELLMAQKHSDEDDLAVIHDLMRYFRQSNYIRIHGKPLILVYRTTLFPDFARTASLWREVCRKEGIGEIYIAQVESFELATSGATPEQFGCDASVEFPPQGMAEPIALPGQQLNPDFQGAVADYRDIAVKYATRELPPYKRFMGVMPGWDNTARRQHNSYCFDAATPGAFQAWLETTVERTKQQFSGDERIVFINAWNEWAEGAYLEPDRRFGHSFLQAHANALDADKLARHNKYSLG